MGKGPQAGKPASLLAVFALLSLALSLLPARGGASAMVVAGVRVPGTVRLGPGEGLLLLNGAGVRRKFFVDVYVGALYLPGRAQDPDTVLNEQGAKRLTLHFLYREASGAKVIGSWLKALSKNNDPKEVRSLAARLRPFMDVFPCLRRGDEVRLDYLPGVGTEIWVNDNLVCTVKGEDFYRALLRVWIGPNVADIRLKNALLGRS